MLVSPRRQRQPSAVYLDIKKDPQINKHTHMHAHPRSQLCACVCVCCQKGNKNISLQILFCFISPFLFVSSPSYECVCVCVGGIGLFVYMAYTLLLGICKRKPLLYVSLRLPWRLSSFGFRCPRCLAAWLPDGLAA